MKFTWTYLIQLISASLFLGAATITAAPVSEEPRADAEGALEVRSGSEYVWLVDAAETARLSELLGVDFGSFGLEKVLISVPKQQCRGCGKHSGLDDIVFTSLEEQVHGKDLMIKVFETREGHASSPHDLRCSGVGCGMTHVKRVSWGEPWIPTGDPE